MAFSIGLEGAVKVGHARWTKRQGVDCLVMILHDSVPMVKCESRAFDCLTDAEIFFNFFYFLKLGVLMCTTLVLSFALPNCALGQSDHVMIVGH